MAFLAHSGSEEEFDPSTLPDPDKYKDSDADQDSESEESYRYAPSSMLILMFFINYFVYMLGIHLTVLLFLMGPSICLLKVGVLGAEQKSELKTIIFFCEVVQE